MSRHFFEGLDGMDRPPKPRDCGLTMVVDWGFGPHTQDDLLTTAGEYFDFAKIAVGLSRLLPNDVLAAKIRKYQDGEVEPFPGGQFLEYAEVHRKAALYLPAVAASGYRWVEVSDNLGAVSLEWKQRMIRQATEAYNLRVLGEVGKKEGLESEVPFADDAKACLEAGAEIILLEAAELVSDSREIARAVEEVVEIVGLEKVMFELPGPWIAGVNEYDIHRIRCELIDRYGPQVNLGNVDSSNMMLVEAYRRELGVNAGQSK